uniref:uncharacterized protein isoform X2 n=1 Tax=Pristiophorus japonicus TaxID=55135 RepID=UPI00398F469E
MIKSLVKERKTSAIAALSVTPGGSPTIQEPLTDTKIRALSLVGDSNRVTSGIEAHPLTQDDANDSDHSDTDDRSTASTSGVTQPSPAASGGGASVGDGGGSTSSMWDSWNILHHHRVYIHGIPPWVL